MELLGQPWSSVFMFEWALPALLLTGLSYHHGLCDKKPVGQQLDWPEITVGFVKVYRRHPSNVFEPLFLKRIFHF